jgi:prepilin-type N-terminal cleavage/methylation domain-containing protein
MKRSGFTLIELLVVIAIIALLIGILMPALGAAMRSARATKCRAQLKNIGAGWVMYADQHPDAMPPAVSLPQPILIAPPGELTIMTVLEPYIPAKEVYECPADDRAYFLDRGTSYEYLPGVAIALDPINTQVIASVAQKKPEIVPILSDAAKFHPAPPDVVNPQLTVYYDAHVDWLWEDVPAAEEAE